jgi:hypothetical protein
MVYFFKTPLPKAGQSIRFASSPIKSGHQLLGPTNLKSTVGQYSRTDHTNTVNYQHTVVTVLEHGLCLRIRSVCHRSSSVSTSTVLVPGTIVPHYNTLCHTLPESRPKSSEYRVDIGTFPHLPVGYQAFQKRLWLVVSVFSTIRLWYL